MSQELLVCLARRRAGRAAAVAALLLCTGCGARASGPNPFDPSAPTGGVEERVRVEVQNLNFNDVTVYALRSAQRVRVGRVSGKADAVFTIEWNVAQPIAFQVDVVASRGCRTGAIGVEAGSRVWLTIPSDMGFGTCRVGRR